VSVRACAYFDPGETIIGTSFMVLHGLHEAR
jgi:hypothetical protein